MGPRKLLGKGYGPDSSEFFSLQEFMIWEPTWSSHRAVFWEQPELLTKAQSQKAGQSSFECIIGSAQSTLSLWLGILMPCVNCSTIHNTKGIHRINDHPEVSLCHLPAKQLLGSNISLSMSPRFLMNKQGKSTQISQGCCEDYPKNLFWLNVIVISRDMRLG